MPVLRSVGSSPTVSTKISEGRISVASMAEGRRASSYCEAGDRDPNRDGSTPDRARMQNSGSSFAGFFEERYQPSKL